VGVCRSHRSDLGQGAEPGCVDERALDPSPHHREVEGSSEANGKHDAPGDLRVPGEAEPSHGPFHRVIPFHLEVQRQAPVVSSRPKASTATAPARPRSRAFSTPATVPAGSVSGTIAADRGTPLQTTHMSIELAHERSGQGSARALAPWLVLLFLGSAAVGAWFLIGPAIAHQERYYIVGYNRTTYEYTRQLLALFIPYGLALLAWRRGSRAPIWVLLAGAAVLHILVLFAPLPQSQDFYQYLFYGRMQAAHGANPYLIAPATFWADPWFAWIRWSNQTSVYGPAWMLVTWGIAKGAGLSLARAFVSLKLVILALDFAIMWMIVRISHDRPDPKQAAGWGILAYAWNPLILITVPLGGSADVALAAAILGAILARRRGRTGVATVLLTVGSLVKVYGIIALVLHLALLVRERGIRNAAKNAAGACAVMAAAYAPYWAGLRTFGGLLKAAGLTNQSLTGMAQRLMVTVLIHVVHDPTPHHGAEIIVRVASGALLLFVVARAIVKVRSEHQLWYLTLSVLAAYLYLTPWYLYWYAITPLALVAVLPRNRLTAPVLTFTGSSLVSVPSAYRMGNWFVQTVLRYAPPIAVLARRRDRARSGHAAPSESPPRKEFRSAAAAGGRAAAAR
jgi:hypothetical protein